MQFMLIFKETAADVAQRANPEAAPAYWGAWNAYVGAMGQAGIVVHGNGLQEPHNGTQVQMRNGKRVIHDGPYADTKEHLGGYFIIEVARCLPQPRCARQRPQRPQHTGLLSWQPGNRTDDWCPTLRGSGGTLRPHKTLWAMHCSRHWKCGR
jgi:hypothetical protein